MQTMLTAFITANTSNSGIPSTKANPISRTFPPLFMIKISEEEKIAEDLHEIDVAIFKSQKDYIRNKQKLLEYICYAQKWQVLSVIFSYAAFTCDIILPLTLIVFFIRYQKTMQTMLTAFITTNTSNSGIPSTKANPISRTFPPLFTMKISEEEKIAEDLHEIESMQLIVQVIMIT